MPGLARLTRSCLVVVLLLARLAVLVGLARLIVSDVRLCETGLGAKS